MKRRSMVGELVSMMWNMWRAFMGPWIWVWGVVVALVVSGWLTHVIVCLKTGQWGFLIGGAIFAPVGVIHGIGIWFGIF